MIEAVDFAWPRYRGQQAREPGKDAPRMTAGNVDPSGGGTGHGTAPTEDACRD